MRRRAFKTGVAAGVLGIGLCAGAKGDAVSASYALAPDVVDAAGTVMTTAVYRLAFAAGEMAGGGVATSSAYQLRAGFIPPVGLTWAYAQRYTFTVQSLHGSAFPPVGIYTQFYGTVLTNQLAAPPSAGGTQYLGAGWTMLGHAPSSGSATSLVMTVTNDAVLTWRWTTNYWLDPQADFHGSVSATNQWLAAGSVTQIWATAHSYYRFTNWSGNVTGAEAYTNPLTLTMTAPKTARAYFDALKTPITQTPLWWLAQYGLPTNEAGAWHEEGDGHPAWKEYVAGTDPTNSASVFQLVEVICGASNHIVLRWDSVTGKAYSVEWATQLQPAVFSVITSGIPAAAPVANTWTGTIAPGDLPRFYRIGVSNAP